MLTLLYGKLTLILQGEVLYRHLQLGHESFAFLGLHLQQRGGELQVPFLLLEKYHLEMHQNTIVGWISAAKCVQEVRKP